MTTVVEMIGAGPGDPDLLTLRAEASLASATVVVVDASVAHLAAAFAPSARVWISPPGAEAAVDGDAIRILIGSARHDERAVRLYRGDPWLHPAYAVESAILASAGVDHVAVPGPSLELAVPGAAGVAVHHPGLAVTLTTATAEGLPPATDPARTLVTVVRARDISAVAAELARAGDQAMPAVVVHAGEGAGTAQRGTLASLAASHPSGDQPLADEPTFDAPTFDAPLGDEPAFDAPSGDEPAFDTAVLVVGAVAGIGTGTGDLASPSAAR
ncbi:MAG: SAM-dependent methyltransferase [Acidimicrobiales bacterium]|nr:SAM-dependent methyltransferase [Acidimicrobiales bacterium]